MFFCYILRSEHEKHKNMTYNGFTTDPWKRLRQHNGEISGGAKTTHGKGPWKIYVLLTGFKTKNNSLSCEWRIRKPTGNKRREPQFCNPVGRIKSLNLILKLPKWTNQCDINNSDCEYTLYITSDMESILEQDSIPPNFKIIIVDKINKESIII